MQNPQFRLKTLSLAVAMTAGAHVPGAFAQSGDDTMQMEELVVTGSYIRRSEFSGAASVQVLDAADIAMTGGAQPVDILKAITANSGSQFYNETNDRAGVAQFNIRNLGLGSTLTLLNGKRAGIAPVADDSGTDFVDINQYPLAMIERIEVLTNGASATYGSQAVAGVANIITRKGFEGFEISGGYTTSEIETYDFNLAAGSQFDRGGFNVYATYYEQGNHERSDFDWMLDRLDGQGDISRSRFLSSTGSPGTYRRATLDPLTGEASDVPGADNNPDPDCLAAGGVQLNPADIGGADSFCRYHFIDQVSVISAEERLQTFFEFDYQLTDQVRFYNESSFSRNTILRDSGGSTLNTGRADGGGFTIPSDHPFNFFVEDPGNPEALIYIGPDAWDNDVHTAADLRAIARPLGKEVNNNALTERIRRDITYTRLLNGVEIELPRGWIGDVSYMWARSRASSSAPHNYRSDVFQDQVASGTWNPFGTRLANPDLVSPKDGTSTAGNSITDQREWDQRSSSIQDAESNVLDIVFSGELFDIPTGTMYAAFGYQNRRTEIFSVPDSLSAAGEANEEGLEAFIEGNQDVNALFGELIVPIPDGEIQLAVRYEDYDTVSTTDPKIAFEWSPLANWGFRGSWGTSFQAPTVRQTASSTSSAFLEDPASPTGPGGSLICNDAGLNNNVGITVQGAPDLAPQESDNYSLGLVFTSDLFRASIDYWRFDYTDLIAPGEGAQAIVENDCADDGVPNDPRVIRDAGGQLRQVIQQFTNVGAVETDGIDLAADISLDVLGGNLNVMGQATYVFAFDVDSDGDGTVDFDGAGSRNFSNTFATMPQLRGNIGASYMTGNHMANVFVRYIDSYENDQGDNAEVDAWTTVDVQYTYTLTDLLGTSGETTLTLGANNLFDEEPPALSTGATRFNPDGTYNRGWIDRPGYDDRAGHDIRGRIVYFRFLQTL
jgi:iron complex outermembrane receptor protein